MSYVDEKLTPLLRDMHDLSPFDAEEIERRAAALIRSVIEDCARAAEGCRDAACRADDRVRALAAGPAKTCAACRGRRMVFTGNGGESVRCPACNPSPPAKTGETP